MNIIIKKFNGTDMCEYPYNTGLIDHEHWINTPDKGKSKKKNLEKVKKRKGKSRKVNREQSETVLTLN